MWMSERCLRVTSYFLCLFMTHFFVLDNSNRRRRVNGPYILVNWKITIQAKTMIKNHLAVALTGINNAVATLEVTPGPKKGITFE